MKVHGSTCKITIYDVCWPHDPRTWTFQLPPSTHATRDTGHETRELTLTGGVYLEPGRYGFQGPASRSVDDLSTGKATPFAASSGDLLADYFGVDVSGDIGPPQPGHKFPSDCCFLFFIFYYYYSLFGVCVLWRELKMKMVCNFHIPCLLFDSFASK